MEVSVIVLTYNQAHTIERTLRSIALQKCDYGFEIIVGDDASTDNTRTIVEDFIEKNPQLNIYLLPPQVRCGVVKNYFRALSHCSGKYVADCAGDDYWLSDTHLQKKYQLMEANPSIAMAHSRWLLFSSASGELQAPNPNPKAEELYKKEVVHGSEYISPILLADATPPIHLSTVLYRKSIIEKAIKENPDFVFNPEFENEDVAILLALASQGKVAFVEEPTLAYSVNDDSISHPVDTRRLAKYYCATARMLTRLAEHYGVDKKKARKAIGKKLDYALACCMAKSDYESSAEIVATISATKARKSLITSLRQQLLLIRRAMKGVSGSSRF